MEHSKEWLEQQKLWREEIRKSRARARNKGIKTGVYLILFVTLLIFFDLPLLAKYGFFISWNASGHDQWVTILKYWGIMS